MASQCQYCKGFFNDETTVQRHQAHAPACRKARDEYIQKNLLIRKRRRPRSPQASSSSTVNAEPAAADEPMDVDFSDPTEHAASELPDNDAQDPDPAAPGVGEPFPSKYAAGATHGRAKTKFEHIRDDQILKGAEVLEPFADEEEWELAKWLIKTVGHNQAEAFLKVPIVSDRVKPSFDNKRSFLDSIDQLPIGAGCKIEHVTLTGDLKDENGKPLTETTELCFRDPVECVRELIGNPAFKDVMDYAPTRLFVDAEGKEEFLKEMSSASWWWKMQLRLPIGSTCVPIILSSDKTRLSQQRGDKSAWPVYLTIGNIAKDTRRKASSHATILLGYLPIGKLDCYTDATRSVAKYRLFHYCMGIIMKSLADAGNDAVQMVCADGFLRQIHPILAAYVADYPEQCLISCCMENRCPECTVLPTERGCHGVHRKRDMDETLDYIDRYPREYKNSQFKCEFEKTLGLRPVPPFWAGLPHTDVFEVFTPDILHQLHKGAFKDHLVSWCTAVVGQKQMDARFKSTPSHPDVRYFKNGISMVSQWTGGEYKEMEKSHTTSSLAAMDAALDVFHENKDIFVELNARTQGHFNILKIHSMEHHAPGIRRVGSADGFNKEGPERLHIDYAKAGYRASMIAISPLSSGGSCVDKDALAGVVVVRVG
ncbi:hypothetical protein R3P38DRAFT_3307632 [Favolaschia claudopus]|uniref:Uncharacterized protein n=1 Tax=Favolaschia claudopus TaxID=2862362 RepID=A0AAW0DD70_9AGAR